MAKIITDTNAWLAYFRNEECALFEMGLSAGVLEIPALVKLELLGNVLTPKERKALEELLSGVPTVGLSDEHLTRAAKFKAEMREKGISLSARDSHILQCAKDREAILLSNDPLFIKIQESTAVKVQMW